MKSQFQNVYNQCSPNTNMFTAILEQVLSSATYKFSFNELLDVQGRQIDQDL